MRCTRDQWLLPIQATCKLPRTMSEHVNRLLWLLAMLSAGSLDGVQCRNVLHERRRWDALAARLHQLRLTLGEKDRQ